MEKRMERREAEMARGGPRNGPTGKKILRRFKRAGIDKLVRAYAGESTAGFDAPREPKIDIWPAVDVREWEGTPWLEQPEPNPQDPYDLDDLDSELPLRPSQYDAETTPRRARAFSRPKSKAEGLRALFGSGFLYVFDALCPTRKQALDGDRRVAGADAPERDARTRHGPVAARQHRLQERRPRGRTRGQTAPAAAITRRVFFREQLLLLLLVLLLVGKRERRALSESSHSRFLLLIDPE